MDNEETVQELAQSTAMTDMRRWPGTPMEMVADAFGVDTPFLRECRNRKAHRDKVQAKRDRRAKLAKASRRRNRR